MGTEDDAPVCTARLYWGDEALVLDAQADKQAFYERGGYTATGRTSLDEGVPHVEMKRIF